MLPASWFCATQHLYRPPSYTDQPCLQDAGYSSSQAWTQVILRILLLAS